MHQHHDGKRPDKTSGHWTLDSLVYFSLSFPKRIIPRVLSKVTTDSLAKDPGNHGSFHLGGLKQSTLVLEQANSIILGVPDRLKAVKAVLNELG
jgi:L-fucose isomerase-like protein